MSEPSVQSFANHRRVVPAYHFFVFGVLALNAVYQVWSAVRAPGIGSVLAVLVAAALIALALHARLFALTAQDRVIRLEERLRLAQLLSADLRPRVSELTPGQLVALRFASDGEIPDLVRQVLDERIADRDEIKKRIRSWRADSLRV